MSPGNHPQNYAIAEQVRTDIPELSRILQLRKAQIQDISDQGIKHKLQAYSETLEIAMRQIAEILDYVYEKGE